MLTLKVHKVPSDELTFTNCAVVSKEDLDCSGAGTDTKRKHIRVQTGPAHHYIFSIKNHPLMKKGEIAFNLPHRRWTVLSLDDTVAVLPHSFSSKECIGAISLSVDFYNKKNATIEPLNSDAMAREFSMQFAGQAFSKGMQLVFRFTDEKKKAYTLTLLVKSIEGVDVAAVASDTCGKSFPLDCGQLIPNSAIVFDKDEGAQINLIGKSKGKSANRSIISPDWDFQKLGVGGVDKQFSAIFRRAFTSRLYPPEFIEQLGMKHVRGILLFGPPGTGKTLIARQIGKMLNAREPKIVNGPQILDKYVGESESNVRKLFADAEEEWRRCGSNSGLHIIIFDEIDAICKQRGSMAGSSSVHDTVVNQLLSKMDGVEQLNNILVIGMTNRRDMIDEALMRPGRLEVQIEIGLPDEFGRLQILRIHTARMREFDKLGDDVDLEGLAKRTKNFSGAEIEGLVRASQSIAMNRHVKTGEKVALDEEASEKLKVIMADFELALENDVKPAFGRSEEEVEKFLRRGFVAWGEVHRILEKGALLVEAAKDLESNGFVTCLLSGASGSGKSCIAARIAKDSEFPFVKVLSPAQMIGFSESAKCQSLHRAFADAIKSPISVLLLDDIESILDYSPIGPRFSNLVLQALRVLLRDPIPQNHRLLVLATSSEREFLDQVGLLKFFDHNIHVPLLSRSEHVLAVLQDSDAFSSQEIETAGGRLQQLEEKTRFGVGVKRMLALIDFVRRSEGDRAELLCDELEAMALGIIGS